MSRFDDSGLTGRSLANASCGHPDCATRFGHRLKEGGGTARREARLALVHRTRSVPLDLDCRECFAAMTSVHSKAMGKCLTCLHAERETIDRALVAGEPLRRLGARFGISKSSLGDHKTHHLAESLRAAAARAGEDREDGLLGELRELQREAKKILREARRSKDHTAALGALAALYRHIELLAKFRPPASEGPPVSRVQIKVGRLGITSEVMKAPEFEIVFGALGPRSERVIDAEEVIALPEANSPPLLEESEPARGEPQPDPQIAVSAAPEAARIRKHRTEFQWPDRDPWAEVRARDKAEDAENEAAARGIGSAKYSGF